MTISTSNRRAGPYLGDGSQTAFPFTFKVFNAGDVRAFVADSQGRERALTYGADYRVTLHDNQEAHPGGQLTLTVALATGEKLAIGSQTAQALRQQGFANIHTPQHGNDSEAALALPIWHTLPQGGTIVIIRGQGGREQLAQTLRQRGFAVQYAAFPNRSTGKLFRLPKPKPHG